MKLMSVPDISGNVQVAVTVGVLLMWALKNKLTLSNQGILSNVGAIFQLVSMFLISMVVILLAPEVSSAEFVFTSFINETGFNPDTTTTYVCFIGVVMPIFSLIGYECGGTIAEETQKASKASPKAMVSTLALSSFAGFIFILSLMFACRGTLDGIT